MRLLRLSRTASSTPGRAAICVAGVCAFALACSDERSPLEPLSPSTIDISAALTTLDLGDTIRVRAYAVTPAGDTIAAQFSWTSSDPGVAAVDAGGLVTALSEGVAVIEAAAAGVTGSLEIVVRDRDLTCASAGGTTVSSSVLPDSVWTRARSPYRVTRSLDLARLRLAPGVLACMSADVVIRLSALHVQGSVTDSVRFVAAAPSVGWTGLRVASEYAAPTASTVRFAIFEDATSALAWDSAMITVEDARFSRTREAAITGGGAIRRVSIDTVCTSPACAAVRGEFTFEDSRIRHSGHSGFIGGGTLRRVTIDGAGLIDPAPAVRILSYAHIEDIRLRSFVGDGIAVIPHSSAVAMVRIRGGSIEGGTGSGIVSTPATGSGLGAPTVVIDQPIRITGNAGYPMYDVPVSALYGVMSTGSAQAMLRGNGRDTIVAFTRQVARPDSLEAGPFIVHDALPAVIRGECSTPFAVTLQPAAFLRLLLTCPVPTNVALSVNGTQQAPAILDGGGSRLRLTGSDTTRIRHLGARDVIVVGAQDSPAIIDHLNLQRGALELSSTGSIVRGSTFTSFDPTTFPFGYHPGAALALGGGTRMESTRIENAAVDGVRVTGDDVVIADCAIRGGAAHAIRVIGTGASIGSCDIENNAGYGVLNEGAASVDARNNWWGDPLGPLGPAGAGVSGSVDYTPFSTAPHGSAGAAASLQQRQVQPLALRILHHSPHAPPE